MQPNIAKKFAGYYGLNPPMQTLQIWGKIPEISNFS